MIFCTECGCESYRWEPAACNEDGWNFICGHQKPGEPPGYCPELDKSHIGVKVNDTLLYLSGELGGASFLYISNGSMGEGLVAHVSGMCEGSGYRDQRSIIQFLFESLNAERPDGTKPADYWKAIGEGVRSGNDIRPRCSCRKLANVCQSGPLGVRHLCLECSEKERIEGGMTVDDVS